MCWVTDEHGCPVLNPGGEGPDRPHDSEAPTPNSPTTAERAPRQPPVLSLLPPVWFTLQAVSRPRVVWSYRPSDEDDHSRLDTQQRRTTSSVILFFCEHHLFVKKAPQDYDFDDDIHVFLCVFFF